METKIIACIMLATVVVQPAHAFYGKLILKHQNVIEGEIIVRPGGAYHIVSSGVGITFGKSEVKKAIRLNRPESDTPDTMVKKARIDNVGHKKYYPLSPEEYNDIVSQAGYETALSPELIRAVMFTESCFIRKAQSLAGACGLMQLMPATAKRLGVKDIYDPRENIFAGARYIRKMLVAFDGDLTLALAAYNAGPSTVRKYKGVPPFKETQAYVKKVLDVFNTYAEDASIYEYSDEKGGIYLYNTSSH